ncbi:MAG: 30S ribosomal protein S8 [Ardenticatenia bacterium]|nr:30S ribosomal protein S8 [Ardenticatenia bacterium]
MMTDPIADMLTRIRNALMVRKQYALVPSSKMKKAIAEILVKEGYIERFDVLDQKPRPMLRLWLKYDRNQKPIITGLKRVSKPGRRIYVGKEEIPWVLSGIGIAILTTSKGIMTDRQARRLGIGGEVICYVW